MYPVDGLYTLNGEPITLYALACLAGVSCATMKARLVRGATPEEAVARKKYQGRGRKPKAQPVS